MQHFMTFNLFKGLFLSLIFFNSNKFINKYFDNIFYFFIIRNNKNKNHFINAPKLKVTNILGVFLINLQL